MKFVYTLALLALRLTSASAQDCEKIVQDCEDLLKSSKNGEDYISDGQVYTAFLDRENAEFSTTFFGGATYRLATSANFVGSAPAFNN